MREFIWFTKNSWRYTKGHRILFFVGFWVAWSGYKKAMKRANYYENKGSSTRGTTSS